MGFKHLLGRLKTFILLEFPDTSILDKSVEIKESSMYGDAPPPPNVITHTVELGPRSQRLIDADNTRKVSQGQKQYWYGEDNFVWARNQENADRKAENKGYK